MTDDPAMTTAEVISDLLSKLTTTREVLRCTQQQLRQAENERDQLLERVARMEREK